MNVRLAGQRAEHADLRMAEQRERDEFEAGQGKLSAQAQRLKLMAEGAERVAPRDYQEIVRWHDVLKERCREYEAQWLRARSAVERKTSEIAATTSEIRINRTRIDAFEERIEAMQREAARTADEIQDEEAQENRRVQVGSATE
ncbi:MAG: hypothetical protein ACTHKH_09355 [Trinickia sp.]